MTKPLVSVIIPAYNAARFVAEAVRSALAQEYATKEIIVINDGSTDDTLDVLKTFGSAIRIIDQKNGGPAVARNAGLHAAHGRYIAFLDADDVWLPGKVAAQVAHLDGAMDVGAVYTAWQIWKPDASGIYSLLRSLPSMDDVQPDDENSGWIYNRLLFDCGMLTTTVMLRASLVDMVGDFDVGLRVGEDYDYWLRLARIAKIHKLRGVGALYRISQSSATRYPHETNYEYVVVSRAVARWGLAGPDGTVTDAQKISDRLDKLIYRHGYSHYCAGDPLIALKAFRNVLHHDSVNPRVWGYLLLSLFKLAGRSIAMRSTPSSQPLESDVAPDL
jgi:glycosyltransferase involved in cell wall biosynthesis